MGKLGRVIKYLNFTQNSKLTLEYDEITNMVWRADGAHAVHPDMRGHTGGIFTLRKGAIYSAQRLHNKEYTKLKTENHLPLRR